MVATSTDYTWELAHDGQKPWPLTYETTYSLSETAGAVATVWLRSDKRWDWLVRPHLGRPGCSGTALSKSDAINAAAAALVSWGSSQSS